MKRHAPAAARNAGPIGDVLARVLPTAGLVLEVASGTGEHAAAFARRFPHLDWQPTDPDTEALESIDAWREEVALSNLRPPKRLDAGSADWPVAAADAVVCINMVHISPWGATLGLTAGAARCLASGGPLILYGPYLENGVATAPSNEAFDASLKARDPAWGLRSVEAVRRAAAPRFALRERVAMPANNLMLLFVRTIEPPA